MKKIKRIGAVICLIILLGLYIWTVVAAVLAKPQANEMFVASVIATGIFSVLFYVFTWFGKVLEAKNVRYTEEEQKQAEQEGKQEEKSEENKEGKQEENQ